MRSYLEAMRKNRVLFLLCLALSIGIKLGAQGIPSPPNPPQLVNDYADLLSPSQERSLEQKLVAYNDSTSTQILIILTPSLDGYPISEFSYELGDAWGVGQSGKDNGLVITVAQSERETFIATGWGIEEYITDVQAKRIVNGAMIPYFKQGNFYGGLDRATDIIIGLLEGSFSAEDLDNQSENDGIPVIIIFMIILIVFIVLGNMSKGNNSGSIGGGGFGGPIIWGGGGSSSSGGGGFGGGGFGGFGGGSFGGGGAGGSW